MGGVLVFAACVWVVLMLIRNGGVYCIRRCDECGEPVGHLSDCPRVEMRE